MGKKYKLNLIETRKSYSIKEIACLLSVHQRTCLRWLTLGLKPIVSGRKPTLVMGKDLKEYLLAERSVNKIKLGENEYYCLKCKCSTVAKDGTENTIETNSLELDSSSGSTIKVTVNASEISGSSSSGSNINIYGKTKTFSASASSGSSIDADKLETINTSVKVSSGANIDVNVSGKLVAKASSGGSIDYEGNPTEVNKDTSSGGSVSGS